MPGITSESVANSTTPALVLTNSILANTNANGSATRVIVGGFVALGTLGSNQYPPSAVISIYAGANGNSSDPLVSTTTVPQVTGSFAVDALITMRANGKAGGANSNAVLTGLFIDPVSAQLSPSTNGNVNVTLSSSNTANISVYAFAGSGQNASLIIETCFITAQS